MITYDPFWETLKRYSASTYELIKSDGISSSAIHRLRHNLPVDTKTLDKLCNALYCSIGDSLSIFPISKFRTQPHNQQNDYVPDKSGNKGYSTG